MAQLGRDARRLLTAARGADGPRGDAERRVWRALAASSATGVVSAAAQSALAAVPAALPAAPAVASWAAIATHVVIGSAVGVAVTATVDVAIHLAEPSTPPPRPSSGVIMAPMERHAPAAPTARTAVMEPAPSAAAPAPPPSGALRRSLTDETARLERAQRAFRGGDPAVTLAELAAYERAYPDGTLREEARATRSLALCASGRVVEGRREAERFATDFPTSPLLPRVERGCAGGPPPAGAGSAKIP